MRALHPQEALIYYTLLNRGRVSTTSREVAAILKAGTTHANVMLRRLREAGYVKDNATLKPCTQKTWIIQVRT